MKLLNAVALTIITAFFSSIADARTACEVTEVRVNNPSHSDEKWEAESGVFSEQSTTPTRSITDHYLVNDRLDSKEDTFRGSAVTLTELWNGTYDVEIVHPTTFDREKVNFSSHSEARDFIGRRLPNCNLH